MKVVTFSLQYVKLVKRASKLNVWGDLLRQKYGIVKGPWRQQYNLTVTIGNNTKIAAQDCWINTVWWTIVLGLLCSYVQYMSPLHVQHSVSIKISPYTKPHNASSIQGEHHRQALKPLLHSNIPPPRLRRSIQKSRSISNLAACANLRI